MSILSSPLLSRPGAVAGQGADAGVPAHFGEPLREHRLLIASNAVVDQSHLDVVTVSVPARLSWLHSITSQHLTDLDAGICVETLVPDPPGRIEQAASAVDDGETTWLTTEPGRSTALAQWLDSMRFMTRVEVTDASEQWAVIGYCDPDAILTPKLDPAVIWDDQIGRASWRERV